MTKIISFRLDESLIDDIDLTCKKLGCNRNVWVKNAIETKLKMEPTDDVQKKPQLIKVEDVEEFDCKDKSLYANGSFYGKCSDFDMNKGKVYAKNGKYLGKIIPHATIEIIE